MIYKVKLEDKHIKMLKEALGFDTINPKNIEDLSYCIQTLLEVVNN